MILMSKSYFPYDLGIKKNIRAVFGPHIWNILWPTKMNDDGLEYPISDSYCKGHIELLNLLYTSMFD